MKCERRDIAIAKSAAGDLSPRRATRLQRHTDNCPRCRSLHQELVQQRLAHHSAIADSSASIADAVLERIAEGTPRGGTRARRWQTAGGAVAFCAFAITATVLVMYRQPPPPAATTHSAPTQMESNYIAPQLNQGPAQSKVVIRLATDNPNVAIYWLGGSAGGM